jgi:DNA-binding MarR family transcriptional regulator
VALLAMFGIIETHIAEPMFQLSLFKIHADPGDGRRVVLSLTDEGQRVLQDKRNTRTKQLAEALSVHFTPAEIRQLATAAPLLERLAQNI